MLTVGCRASCWTWLSRPVPSAGSPGFELFLPSGGGHLEAVLPLLLVLLLSLVEEGSGSHAGKSEMNFLAGIE